MSVGLNWLLPGEVLGILLNAVGSALLVIWVFIAVSQLRLRRRLEAAAGGADRMTLRMWAYPWLTWATLAGLAGLIVLMLFDDAARVQLVSTVVLVGVIVAVYGVRSWLRKRTERADVGS